MIPGQHISAEDLTLYAMQLLGSQEAAQLAQHLEVCPECRLELQAAGRDLALYALTAEMHSPPAQARLRLMKQVGRERRAVLPPVERAQPQTQPQTQPLTQAQPTFSGRSTGVLRSFDLEEPPRRNVFVRVVPWVGWAVAASIGFFAVNLYHQNDALRAAQSGQQVVIARMHDDAEKAQMISDMLADPTATRVTLTPTKLALPATPTARVTYAPAKGVIILQASNMEPLQPYKTYELWLIPADGRDPMPAGIFHPDIQGNTGMVTSDIPKGVIAKEFGITVEDEGGSKVPSTPIIMVGL